MFPRLLNLPPVRMDLDVPFKDKKTAGAVVWWHREVGMRIGNGEFYFGHLTFEVPVVHSSGDVKKSTGPNPLEFEAGDNLGNYQCINGI